MTKEEFIKEYKTNLKKRIKYIKESLDNDKFDNVVSRIDCRICPLSEKCSVVDADICIMEQELKDGYNKLFLLSKEEYVGNKEFIPTESPWWLRSPSPHYYGDLVRYVMADGNIDGDYSFIGNYGVRPAFRFKFDIYEDKSVGSIIRYGKLDCIKLNDGIYLSKDIVFNYHFDKKSNDYNISDIKKKLKEYESLWLTNEELNLIEDFNNDKN